MSLINQMIIIGNLGRDVEVKATNNGTLIAKFSVAVNKKSKEGKETTTWVNVQAWRNLAEACCNLKKGDRVVVIGEYVSNAYMTTAGEKKYFNSLNAAFIAKPILSSEKNNQNNAQPSFSEFGTSVSEEEYNAQHSNEEIPF